MQLQQGDVNMETLDSLPKGAKLVLAEAGSFIFAKGEVTGHAHRVKAIAGLEFYEKDGAFFLVNHGS